MAVFVTALAWSAATESDTGPQRPRTIRRNQLHAIVASVPESGTAIEQLPDGRWVVSIPEDLLPFASVPAPALKSAVTYAETPTKVVVTFYRDVSAADTEAVLNAAGVARFSHPDLLPNERLIEAEAAQIASLTEWDEVAHVYPASEELAAGAQVRACAGPAQSAGQASFYIATEGNGWDGAGAGSADLTWSVHGTGGSLPAEVVTDTIRRALEEWSRHGALQFRRSYADRASRDIAFFFTRGEHLDAYPFDGRGGILAHAFYPVGVNPEPIAGDVHVDDDETWTVGGDPDLYSVVLHEIGHALGLGHSDRPGSVMYPYHRRLDTLQADDIAALQRLYSAPSGRPLQVELTAPAVTAQSAVQLAGAVTGGRGQITVRWTSETSSGPADGGRQWRTPVIPLIPGKNTIVITASDESGATAYREAVVNTSSTTPPQTTGRDQVNPSVSITFPAVLAYGTSAPQVRIRGTARDNVGVREVTWQCGSRSGVASGAGAWSFDLPLLAGYNQVIVRAYDHTGNSGSRSVLVTRR